jgi:hypothetical protein
MSRERDRAIADLNVQLADAELYKIEREAGGTLTPEQEKQFENVQSQRKGTIKVLEAERAEENLYTKASKTIGRGAERTKQTGYSLNRWLANIPTPGGVLAAFLVLLFIFMLLIQVNDHSRLFWLWLVIIGRASIPSNETTSSDQGKKGVAGDFTFGATTSTETSSTTSSGSVSGGKIIGSPVGTIGSGSLSNSAGFTDLFFSAMGEFA